MPAPEIIQGVLELAADIDPEGLKVLDVSCRRGELLTLLKRRGFCVHGTNFDPAPAPIEGVAVDGGVDLTRGLPYPEASFDLVLLTEVIEHLDNHRAAIGELSRVLKPGGRLILTTPNVMRLDSRLGFLLAGLHKAKRRPIPLDTPLELAHRYHNYPITFPLLYYLLHANGLEVERLGHGRVKAVGYVLFPLLYPLVALDTRYRLWWRERRNPARELNRALIRWLTDPRMLMEDNLILRARKTGRPACAPTSQKPAAQAEGRAR